MTVDIEFKYVKKDDYSPDYVNGVHGGVNSNGDIVAHFFQEISPIPESTICEFSDVGEIINETNKPEDLEQEVWRVVKSGITMNYKTAVKFREWLNQVINDHENRQDVDK